MNKQLARWIALALTFGCGAAGAATSPPEHLGTVSFVTSCAPAVHRQFNRGVALLHDFWYAEAQPQFERILKADPSCAMAHWGVAMSVFHQIWERPDETATAHARAELQAAQAHPARSARERAYVAALAGFFADDKRDYQARIDGYAAAMLRLHERYPHDIDAGAFYALALLAATGPEDTSLAQNYRAMEVLQPLYLQAPSHPGVVHYIIHACDTPALASDGLVAARHYGAIAGSAPHSAHMPGHIFARLGLWPEDIAANVASVNASGVAEARHQHGAMDQFHSDDFLAYAYLQAGDDALARSTVAAALAAIAHFEAMPDMGPTHGAGMFPHYRAKLPAFLALETRDWAGAAALEPIAGAPGYSQTVVYWARAIADGHLRQPERAQADLAAYDALVAETLKGPYAYFVEGTDAQVTRGEIQAWSVFAGGKVEAAVTQMRASAELQDKVGQGEVDIPAREMLADMLLESGRPADALVEYRQSLRLSPDRFNGLYNAGRAAEALGNTGDAARYFQALLKSTNNGANSARPELEHARQALGQSR